MFTISLAGKHTFKKDVRKLTILCLKRGGNSSFCSIEVFINYIMEISSYSKIQRVNTGLKKKDIIIRFPNFPIELLLRSVSDASLWFGEGRIDSLDCLNIHLQSMVYFAHHHSKEDSMVTLASRYSNDIKTDSLDCLNIIHLCIPAMLIR